MFVWADNLYIDESLADKDIKKLKRRIKLHWFVKNIYLVTEATCPENKMDIISASYMRFSYYKKRTNTVYGVAKGQDKAEMLAARIVAEVYDKTGDVNISEYFAK